MENETKNKETERSPVIVIMGHIDHGKSTLLDYIRKTNIVEKEAGGITQHLSAYEVTHKDEKGMSKKITFLDTPGHEAFSQMRERGAQIADIAILIVSATEGVKPQTIEAWKTITLNKIPFIVAINKIDMPNADIEKVKMELSENGIYLEGHGGDIPFTLISAKNGKGVDELLSLINILAEMEGFKGDETKNASGLIIEADLDPKRGIEATLVIKNGTIKKGMTVVSGDSICSTRMMKDFKSNAIDEATFSSPILLIGWNKIPKIGTEFISFENKKEAEKYVKDFVAKQNEIAKDINTQKSNSFSASNKIKNHNPDKKIIPIVIKADVSGSLEAIEKEVKKIKDENAEFKIISKGEGNIREGDIKTIADGEKALVIGFNVKADASAVDLAERRGVSISFFDVIYKATDWLKEEMEKRRPRKEVVETNGRAKIIKVFSRTKERQIIGGKVIDGIISKQGKVKIMRRDNEIGQGKIINLETGKIKVNEVKENEEFGMMLESKTEIVSGDKIESFSITQK